MKRMKTCATRGCKPACPVGRAAGFALKLFCKLLGFAFLAFALTFGIFMFNLENKLLYYVVRPFLNKHYDAQVRDRRI